MQRPLTRFTVFLAAGILLGSLFLHFPWSAVALSLLAGSVVALRILRASALAGPLLLASAGVALGAVLLVLAVLRMPAGHYLASGPPDGAHREVAGRIVSPLDRDPGRTAFILEVSAIDGRTASGRLRVSVRSDLLPAGYGDRITARGRLFPPRGFRNPGGFDYPAHLARQGIHAVLSIRRGEEITIQAQGSGLLRRVQDLRERIRRNLLQSTAGDGSAVLQAMVLGEEGGLTAELRDRFMAAGVTHILSISGSHLGLVAVLCFWTSRRILFLLPERSYHRLTLRLDPRKAAAVLTVLPVAFYAFLAGGQVATLRALIMVLAGLAALVMDREGDALSALSLAALVTLLPSPRALYDISFQLSYLSVLTIVLAVRDWQALMPPAAGIRRWLRAVLLLLLISLAASAATGPLVAYHFNQVSLAGIAANMAVVPFAGAVVVPLGLASGMLSLLTDSLPLAGLNQAAADFFVAMVDVFASLPFASLPVASPSPLALAAYGVLLLSLAVLLRSRLYNRYRPLEFPSRQPRRLLVAAGASAALLVLAVLLPLATVAGTRVTFLDVGQGDCALVEAGEGRILVDGGGTRDNRFDIGRRVVLPYLHDRGIRDLDLVVLSHPHPDHMQGLLAVLQEVRVAEVWWSGRDGHLGGFAELQQRAKMRGSSLRVVTAGDRGTAGSAELEVLHPPGEYLQPRAPRSKAYAAENDRSLAVRIRTPAGSLLFTGDLHREGETALLASGHDLRADVVKVPHHGSRTSSSAAFIEAVRPAVAVVSVGEGNPYRQPAEEVVGRYTDAGAAVFRTDRDGAVILRSAGAGLGAYRAADLLLQRIDALRPGTWGQVERENWERLWIRTAEI